MPRHLNPRQLRGLLKVGDLLVPGDGELPSFSRSGCAEEADRVLAYLNEADRKGLLMLLGVFSVTPVALLRGLLRAAEGARASRGPIATGLRMILIGVKGLVMSLYWSDVGPPPSVLGIVGWDAKVVEREGA